ncbi:MAG: methylglyoxal synthase [Spirochaetaceae bacterium]|nr:methylglyoxal synthase [Spirochaetaceae bacterium]
MENTKNIALVAHDNRKKDLIEWLEYNWRLIIPHKLYCTGTTGRLVEEAILKKISMNYASDNYTDDDLNLIKLKSGPLGGDQQLGSLIAEGEIDILIFLWDPMEPQPHDVDVKALARIAVLYNIPIANNRSTADFLISSPLFQSNYKPVIKNYAEYIHRKL